MLCWTGDFSGLQQSIGVIWFRGSGVEEKVQGRNAPIGNSLLCLHALRGSEKKGIEMCLSPHPNQSLSASGMGKLDTGKKEEGLHA